MGNIIVVGSINMDIVTQVARHPLPGETVLGSGIHYFAGGKGANQAVAAARSGAPVILVGAVGNDSFADELWEGLDRAGVRCDFIMRKPGASGLAFITVDDNGENTIILSRGANGLLTPSDIDPVLHEIFGECHAVLLQNEMNAEINKHVIDIAKRCGVRVYLNPAPAETVSAEMLALIDVLIVNRIEAKTVTGVHVSDLASAHRAACAIVAAGVQETVISLGGDGAYYLNRDGDSAHVPAFVVTPVDTTGAGDTFIGALAAARSIGRAPLEALRFASAAAAISVTRPGAQIAIPTYEETVAFMEGKISS